MEIRNNVELKAVPIEDSHITNKKYVDSKLEEVSIQYMQEEEYMDFIDNLQ